MPDASLRKDLAHELRTPLAIVKTSTEIALLEPLIPPALKATLQETLLQVDRMSAAIDAYLDDRSR
jgi:signal transduction histidine kinase